MYKKFINLEDAMQWGKIHYSFWLPMYQTGGKLRQCFNRDFVAKLLNVDILSLEQLKDAQEYQWFSYYCGGSWGLAINQKLRTGHTEYSYVGANLEEMQAVMDACLNVASIPENIWAYRFLNYENLCKCMRRSSIRVGMVIQDRGYMGVGLVKSTLEKDFGHYDTLLKIMIPKGAHGMYIDLISARMMEQEILFARDSRLLVLCCYRWKNRNVIVCKMLF